MSLPNKNIAILQQAGIVQPFRMVKLIRNMIAFFGLDLSGQTVLTEAASGPYVVTPVIAALAGAERVLALTQDSQYASAEKVKAQTQALQSLCGLEDRVEIHTRRSLDLFAQADIVTNLGFVRPLDAYAIGAMKPGAAIPLMCESWEFRPGDVDLAACRNRGISVFGTNEDFPGLEVFSYSGLVSLKMLIDAQIEVHKSRIVVVSDDKFGAVIERLLTQAGAVVKRVKSFRAMSVESLSDLDAVVMADYARDDFIIGPDGDLEASEFARLSPGATIIQFAGRIDVKGLLAHGVYVYPNTEIGSRRMGQTLASLGPRPVIELHTAGLKVGELTARHGLILTDSIWQSLTQPIV